MSFSTEFQRHEAGQSSFLARLADKCVSIGVSPKKAAEYLGGFLMLTAIYYFYFVRDARENVCPPDETITFAQLGVLMLKFFICTSWPFVLVAFLDSEWSGKDAGNLFLAAYLFTNFLWYLKTGCAPCIFAASFRIIPYVFCAMMAHALGTARHRARKAL